MAVGTVVIVGAVVELITGDSGGTERFLRELFGFDTPSATPSGIPVPGGATAPSMAQPGEAVPAELACVAHEAATPVGTRTLRARQETARALTSVAQNLVHGTNIPPDVLREGETHLRRARVAMYAQAHKGDHAD